MDGSTTVVAEGKVRTYVQKGEQLPEGWIRDGYGHDTTDPMALYRDPPGTIYPVGGKNSGGQNRGSAGESFHKCCTFRRKAAGG